ncbi:hypothetical protein GUITHDRAFT_84989 [Guillardia theta CCMP2712]|uniref:aspartyl aminopeptidase n=2 Tax=Guillardia theta TaxID=55529 RepID=L1JSM4_GUITC|nr:hypothetical protein GUITHDRAFT_84989 [Guillardia theta CCMP2712]EKX51447.1 hypothetical protein GUITHDRAFT_84989 [Guillardia theta CCMP2712]|eukprot:XP_005838427.1 hypothetical protein GUITHDRAFT_84989 [Guillardia theta CCMP2712]
MDAAKSLGLFLRASPTPYQMVETASNMLVRAGFKRLPEDDVWKLQGQAAAPGKYFYIRAASTIVAFAVSAAMEKGSGYKIVGAHTDSPVLKVKPVSKKNASGYMQLGVECYGGGLWHTWLDRELSLAGCAIVEENGVYRRKLVHMKRPVLRIPSLCIHLQTADERAKLDLNKETHLVPILAMVNEELNKTSAEGADSRHAPELLSALAEELGCTAAAIKDLDLTLYDTQPEQIWGLKNEFLSSPRLDNQAHCFTALEALVSYTSSPEFNKDPYVSAVVCFDHEEVGSTSAHGAGSPIIKELVERVNNWYHSEHLVEHNKIALQKSFIISADVAHAVHPNYASKHESNHGPLLNKGTVIKTNTNQRYATSVTTGFVIRELARRAGINVQEFVVRNDCPCGSTIGPIVAASTGISTVDVGIPSLSMHSIRETIGVHDVENSIKLFSSFFVNYNDIIGNCEF